MASEMCVHVYVGINQKPHTTLTHTKTPPTHTNTPTYLDHGPAAQEVLAEGLDVVGEGAHVPHQVTLEAWLPFCVRVCVVGLCLRGALIGVVVDGSNSTCSFIIHVLRGVSYLAVAEFVGAGLRLLEKPLPGAA